MVQSNRLHLFELRGLFRLAQFCVILVLAACASIPPPGPTSAQRALLTANGFVETDRGWELGRSDRFLFASDDSKLFPHQQANIAALGTALLSVGIGNAWVEGHTDNTGTVAHNRKLSLARAKAVAAALRQSGIDLAAEVIQGRGEDFPVGDNRTVDGRADNRRVVIIVTP